MKNRPPLLKPLILSVLCLLLLICSMLGIVVHNYYPAALVSDALLCSAWLLPAALVLGCACLLMVLLICILYFKKECSEKTGVSHHDACQPRADVALEQRYYERAQKYQQDIRKYRHDFKNHILVLSGLLNSGDIEGAKRHIHTIDATLRQGASLLNTGNPAIDTFLSEKLAAADNLGIRTDHTIGLSPDMRIDPVDFCMAVGCCLDNAIEACKLASSSGCESAPHITLHIVEQRGVVVFKMVNTSFSQTAKKGGHDQFPTTKGNPADHGFGLKNVADIIAKYDGYLDLQQTNKGVFITSFTLFVHH